MLLANSLNNLFLIWEKGILLELLIEMLSKTNFLRAKNSNRISLMNSIISFLQKTLYSYSMRTSSKQLLLKGSQFLNTSKIISSKLILNSQIKQRTDHENRILWSPSWSTHRCHNLRSRTCIWRLWHKLIWNTLHWEINFWYLKWIDL